MAKSSFEATQEFFDGWLELYQATIGKMAQVPAMGPAREKSEKLTEGFSRFANFFTASWDSTVDLQCVYMDAVSKFLATAAGEAEDENGFDGQEDFYKTWSETYGETFKEFLESGHFA
ncbi:MAG: poly(R)-hydroxyalkanoic acid synthase subunit PhaE, partial [Terriglobia bacterium]